MAQIFQPPTLQPYYSSGQMPECTILINLRFYSAYILIIITNFTAEIINHTYSHHNVRGKKHRTKTNLQTHEIHTVTLFCCSGIAVNAVMLPR